MVYFFCTMFLLTYLILQSEAGAYLDFGTGSMVLPLLLGGVRGAKYVLGFYSDQGALEAEFARARKENLSFQALDLDAMHPTPDQGWMEHERAGLQSRAKADGVLALAFVHHLAIARNVPLEQALDWIIGLAPTGVIEFVPKEDRMVQTLLLLREDIFPNYTEKHFRACISRRARIVKAQVVSSSGRLLVWFERFHVSHQSYY